MILTISSLDGHGRRFGIGRGALLRDLATPSGS